MARTDIGILVGIALLAGLVVVRNWRTAEASPPPAGLDIKNLVNQVRSELREASQATAGSGEAPTFQLKDFDLEIQFVITRSKNNKDSFTLTPLTLETSSAEEVQRAHKITIHYEPFKQELIAK